MPVLHEHSPACYESLSERRDTKHNSLSLAIPMRIAGPRVHLHVQLSGQCIVHWRSAGSTTY